MSYFLQLLGLKKHALTFTDANGNEIKMVQAKPRWLTALQSPMQAVKKRKNVRRYDPFDFLANNAYASPGCYIDNPDLLKEFEEECTSSKISLQSVHDCLTAKLDPGVAFKKFHGNRPMHYAARHGEVMMARMLIRAGGKVQVKNSLGQTPLMVAASGRFPHHSAFLRFAIEHGGDVETKDRGGNTALVLAVISGASVNVGILLHHKATVVQKTKEILAYEDPEALAIAKYVRACDNNLSIEDCEEFIELERILGPSLLDRVFRFGICGKSHRIVDMLERANDGTYLNYYEIHLGNAKQGMWWFFERVILGKKPVKKAEVAEKKILQMQMADPKQIDIMQEKTRLARLRRKELEFNQVMAKNLEAAREEIARVESVATMAMLYGKRDCGTWERRDGWVSSVDAKREDEFELALEAEDRRKGKKVKKKKQEAGRQEAKSRWDFHQVYAEKSLGGSLNTRKFLGAGSEEHQTMEEQKEQRAIAKLAAKLKEIDGKELWELDFHETDFDINISNVPREKDDEGTKTVNGHVVPVAGLTAANLAAHTLSGHELRALEEQAARDKGGLHVMLKEGMSSAMSGLLKKKGKEQKKEQKEQKKEQKEQKAARKRREMELALADSSDSGFSSGGGEEVVAVVKKAKKEKKKKKERR